MWKACKYKRELEIDTKTDVGTSLVLQTKVVFPPKHPLKVMHPNCPLSARNASTSRHQYSHVMREPTPTPNIIGVIFGIHTLLGPWELVPFLTQTNLVAKFESCI